MDQHHEALAIEHVFAQLPTTGGGQLYVAVRDGLGRRRGDRAAAALRRHRNGRWLNHMTALGGGDHRILIAPASHRDLVTWLQEMYNSLSR
jgi:hypothetical protein